MLNQSREKSIEFVKKQAFEVINSTKLYSYKGTVSKLLGLTVEVKLPGLKIGDLCYIQTDRRLGDFTNELFLCSNAFFRWHWCFSCRV